MIRMKTSARAAVAIVPYAPMRGPAVERSMSAEVPESWRFAQEVPFVEYSNRRFDPDAPVAMRFIENRNWVNPVRSTRRRAPVFSRISVKDEGWLLHASVVVAMMKGNSRNEGPPGSVQAEPLWYLNFEVDPS